MKTRVEQAPKEGGLQFEVMVTERTDDIDVLPFEKLVTELQYMCIRTVGEFMDKYEDVMRNILERYPHFFDELEYTKEDIKKFLEEVE